MPQVDFKIKTVEVFRQSCTNTARRTTAGFDPVSQDVPDFEIEGFIQINADGTWSQTSTVNTTGGSGSMRLWLA